MKNCKALVKGDYVLATKWTDGDPMDHFCVGFVDGMTEHTAPRYDIVDGAGNLFRINGFRRAEKITKEEGSELVSMFSDISDKYGPSLWWHLNYIRGKEYDNCDGCRYEKKHCKCGDEE